jgi:hemin uptake protein HemP
MTRAAAKNAPARLLMLIKIRIQQKNDLLNPRRRIAISRNGDCFRRILSFAGISP